MNASEKHTRWMLRALALARRGEGLTRPNPPVGAVLVKNGRALGEGFHAKAGGPHAEIVALERAGAAAARGAVLYVTLEPCSTWGKTPPCVDAIIRSRLREVVVGVRDPNPRHNGRGIRALRKAGINVIENVCEQQARELIAPFARWITAGLPFVTLKLAVSLDGKIADASGASKWLTSETARKVAHALRRRADAVLIGAATAAADDPSLLPRPARGRAPLRVIVAGRSPLRPTLRVFTDEAASRTIVAAAKNHAAAVCAALSGTPATVWKLPVAPGGGVDLRALARRLGEQGVLHVACEGGGKLAGALVRAGLVDEYVFFIAPKILGGRNAPPAVAGEGWPLARCPRLAFVQCRKCGADIMLRAKPLKFS